MRLWINEEKSHNFILKSKAFSVLKTNWHKNKIQEKFSNALLNSDKPLNLSKKFNKTEKNKYFNLISRSIPEKRNIYLKRTAFVALKINRVLKIYYF